MPPGWSKLNNVHPNVLTRKNQKSFSVSILERRGLQFALTMFLVQLVPLRLSTLASTLLQELHTGSRTSHLKKCCSRLNTAIGIIIIIPDSIQEDLRTHWVLMLELLRIATFKL